MFHSIVLQLLCTFQNLPLQWLFRPVSQPTQEDSAVKFYLQ